MVNRLAKEKSPYLLQHAENPVDWYPWSDEPFARAAEEDKPIFLSIGYSTCHWCHVMERESFENEEVARLLNDTFICIKVDREERPDIDNIYMTVCSMMTGGGGWPLTIIMTPDKKPFFAGTYFARESGNGRIGMLDMIPRLNDIWKNRREEVVRSSENIGEILQKQNRVAPGSELDREILHKAFKDLSGRYDPVHAGFGSAPKFPTPHNISFLLRYWKLTGDDLALSMAAKSLQAFRLGGIYDHIGFGFHRYSTDKKWLLPHFEKMLYDQALLATAYLETYQATGNRLFRQTAEETFTYVLRDMTAPEGGFFSAEDADSEGVEGKFYVWSHKELREILSPDELELVSEFYNIKAEGNFHDEATGRLTGDNILHLSAANSTYELKADADQEKLRQKLFDHRKKRIHPHKDDKILTDWNGLMIGALAMGAKILGREKYQQAAARAADFILREMRYDKNRLLHRYRENEAAVKGMLGDYAFLVYGLLELYEAGFDPRYLREAVTINDLMLELFWDEKDGGFFLTPDDGELLLIRPKEIYDGALPSGNSIGLANLLRLERLTGSRDYGSKAKLTIRAFSDAVREVPGGYTRFLSGLYSFLTPSTEIVVVGDPNMQNTREMVALCQKSFSPNSYVILKDPEADDTLLSDTAPFIAEYTEIDNKPTAYVCQNFSCKAPTTDIKELEFILNN